MRKLLLSLGFLALWVLPAAAQQPCIGVGGVNTVPQTGVSCQTDSLQPTYGATAQALVIGTAPTDISCLSGAASTVIRLKRLRLGGTAGTAINVTTYLTKHVSLDTGGTAATGTALPVAYALDSNNATAKATPTAWTVNPTVNDATPGILGAVDWFMPATGTAVGPGATIFYFDQGGYAYQPPTLRKSTEQLCVNLNGVTAPSSSLSSIEWIWTEATQ